MFVHPFYIAANRLGATLQQPDENIGDEYVPRFNFSNILSNVDFLLASAIGGMLLMLWLLLLVIAVFIIGSLVGLIYQVVFWTIVISFLLLPDIFDSWYNNNDIPGADSLFVIRRRLISQVKTVPKLRRKTIISLSFCRWKPRTSLQSKYY